MKTNDVLILTYWPYQDALIQTYTLPYVRIIKKHLPPGSKIFLVTLEKSKPDENNNSVQDPDIVNIRLPYIPFSAKAAAGWLKNLLSLYKLIKRENISTIHAWCTPAGMIAYLLSVLTKRKLIVDSFEPHAEAMTENGEWKPNGIAFRVLFKYEKLQFKKAAYLIAAAEGMKTYSEQKYGKSTATFFVKPACVNLALFSEKNIKNKRLLSELGLEEKIVGVYAGKFGGIYHDKIFFDLLKVAETHWKGKFRALILSSHTTEYIGTMAANAGLLSETIVHKFIDHRDIPDYMGLADFGITPVKSVPTKRYCTPIKDGEYWALGLPVLITANISDDSGIIEREKIGSVLSGLTTESYLSSIREIDQLLKTNTRMELYNKIRPIAEKYRNFEIAENVYSSIYGNKG